MARDPNYCAGCGVLLGKCLSAVVETPEGLRFCSADCRRVTQRPPRDLEVKPDA